MRRKEGLVLLLVSCEVDFSEDLCEMVKSVLFSKVS